MGLQAQIKNEFIPEGQNEKEIWQIFETLFNLLQEGDGVVYDITHAFRSIPMLAIVALNYAKVLKNISVEGIYYGAFEVLGTPKEAEKIPLEERRVPILDLTAFDSLLAWGTALDRFLGAGDASQVAALAHQAVHPILRDAKGADASARAIRDLATRLQDFSQDVATCRGPRLSSSVQRLKAALKNAMHLEVLPPLRPLLNRLFQRLAAFEGSFVQDGLQAAQWCLEHNLIQQGFTILQEFLISYVARQNGLDDQNKTHRTLASQAAAIADKQIPEDGWKPVAKEHPDLTRRLLEFFQARPRLARIYADLTQFRNDLNHAGFIANPTDADRFSSKLEQLISELGHHL